MEKHKIKCPYCGADYNKLHITLIAQVDYDIEKDGSMAQKDVWYSDYVNELDGKHEASGFCEKCGNRFTPVLDDDYEPTSIVAIKKITTEEY